MQLVVPRAGVERLADDERRRLEDPGPVPPDDLPCSRGHCGDHPRLAARVPAAGSSHERLHPGVVDDPVRNRRRGRGAVLEAALPDGLPRPMMDGVEASALLGEIEATVGDRRRELENVARLERPAEPIGRPKLEIRRRVRSLHAQAVRRPREAEDDPTRARRLGRVVLLRGDELHGRRTPLVLDRALVVNPDADEQAGDDDRDSEAHEKQYAPGAQRLRTTTRAESRRPPTSMRSA